MVIVVVVVVVAAEAVENSTKESKCSQKILKQLYCHQPNGHGSGKDFLNFFGWSDLLAKATGECRRRHSSCGYAAEGVLWQWPSEFQANS